MQFRCASVLISVSCLSIASTPEATFAATQDEVPQSMSRSVFFSIPTGFEYQFRTDIGSGGRFDVLRANAGLITRIDLPQDMDLSFRLNYSLDDYNFRGSGRFGDGWDDIHTLGFGAILSAQLSPDWRVFGGPVFQFSRESGASWSRSFIGGGVVGATYQHSDYLTIGGGFGVVSQIEDSARFYPVLILNWRLMDNLTLASTTSMNASGGGGVELIYDVGGGWEAAIGASARYRRFRLDENNDVPHGVGEERSIPVYGRLSYAFNPQFRLNGYAGVAAAGKLRMEDRSGSRIARRNYDAAPFVGISGVIQF